MAGCLVAKNHAVLVNEKTLGVHQLHVLKSVAHLLVGLHDLLETLKAGTVKHVLSDQGYKKNNNQQSQNDCYCVKFGIFDIFLEKKPFLDLLN